ncbi:MAG: type III polyketide synthase [Sphingobacteriaceae bacterium]|nr:type III polyketide synthase [Sphingobacteriaceae bacterium]
MSFLTAIHSAVPSFEIKAADFEAFVAARHPNEPDTLRKLRFLSSRTGINQRFAVLPDYADRQKARLYWKHGEIEHASIQKRMEIYREEALRLSLAAIRPVLAANALPPTHLVFTSCTGLSAPGIEVQLVRALGLPAHTFRHTVNFMGCYAALHALRTAHYICEAESEARVLVVCTELCSLHYQEATHDDAMLSNLLFGDGSAALMLCGAAHAAEAVLEIDGFFASLLPGGESDMSWDLSGTGFEMKLSSYVPALLSGHLDQALAGAWEAWGLQQSDIQHWALHPGGRSILEKLQQALKLQRSDLAASYEVLERHGNMSSATVLFVLQQLLANAPKAGERVVLAAFGPGLSMELGTARFLTPASNA